MNTTRKYLSKFYNEFIFLLEEKKEVLRTASEIIKGSNDLEAIMEIIAKTDELVNAEIPNESGTMTIKRDGAKRECNLNPDVRLFHGDQLVAKLIWSNSAQRSEGITIMTGKFAEWEGKWFSK